AVQTCALPIWARRSATRSPAWRGSIRRSRPAPSRAAARTSGSTTRPPRTYDRRVSRIVSSLLFSFAALLSAVPSTARSQPLELVSVYLTAASDYRHRGLSESRGRPSLQLGADFQHRSGFFAGAWTARIEAYAEDEHETSSRYKAAYYAGYTRRASSWNF